PIQPMRMTNFLRGGDLERPRLAAPCPETNPCPVHARGEADAPGAVRATPARTYPQGAGPGQTQREGPHPGHPPARAAAPGEGEAGLCVRACMDRHLRGMVPQRLTEASAIADSRSRRNGRRGLLVERGAAVQWAVTEPSRRWMGPVIVRAIGAMGHLIFFGIE